MLTWAEGFSAKAKQVLTLPNDGEFGFYNSLELVKRGFEIWRAQGRMPSRDEVEQIDLFWQRDLLTMSQVARYTKDISDFENGRTEQVEVW